MKICIDARVIINQRTGIGNYSYNLIKSLLEIDKENKYYVFINKELSKDHPIFFLEQKNLLKKIVDIPPVSVQQQYLISNELRKIKPDLYHYPNWDVPIFHNINSIFTLHDLTYLLHNKLYINFSYLKKLYTYLNIYFGMKKAEVIVVSESTKNDLLNIFRISPDKVKVIYEACDESFLKKDKTHKQDEFLSKLGVNDKYFLFVGEKRPHKNLLRIIRAFKHFNNNIKNYKLIIVGKQYAEYDEPTLLVKKLNLNKDVIFCGYVDTETLIHLYYEAEALVFASIYEGFGIPILEAMACGTPVITSNISAMPEVSGGAALTVDPYSINEIVKAMIQITMDLNLRQKLVERGMKRVKHFSWIKTAEKTLKLYESIF